MSTGIEDSDEQKLLRAAQCQRVRYQHPGLFIAGDVGVQIPCTQLGHFLAQLATVMGADQPGAGTDPYSRFKEYDQLVRMVYLGATREAAKARLFEKFLLSRRQCR